MSQKGKTKVIQVDKLIVKANEVIIVDEERKRNPRFDRWGFPTRNEVKNTNVDIKAEDSNDVKSDIDVDDEKRRPPFSWI
jgi:hypothetical protein